MIKAFYWPREQRLLVAGHEITKGEDALVCAAVSAAMINLANTCDGFEHAHWVKKPCRVGVTEGMAYVRIYPKRKFYKHTRVAIGMVAGLLMQLAEETGKVEFEVATGAEFNDPIAEADFINGSLSYEKDFVYADSVESLTDEQKG